MKKLFTAFSFSLFLISCSGGEAVGRMVGLEKGEGAKLGAGIGLASGIAGPSDPVPGGGTGSEPWWSKDFKW